MAAEISVALVARVKDCLRVKSTSADEEVFDLIRACLSELEIAGVYATDLDDPKVVQAVRLYCKAHYGYDSGTERFALAYAALRDAMALSGDYTKDGDSDE